jgi:signal transduction histidine kinase
MAKILIVDDHPTNRQFLVTLLGYSGHGLLEAGDGAEGLALLRAERPDLVITDILMPTVDGYELARQVRAAPELAHTQIIFYTATYLEVEARELAHACGVHYLLTKPTEPQEILDVVAAALEGKPPAPAVHDKEFDREHLRLLTSKLAEKVDELEDVNAALRRAERRTKQLNAELERRVAERTAQLELANKEMESFAYSVSHDLRAPLRAIFGFSEILATDYREQLDENGRHLIERIQAASRRMGQLIEDLLDLSRISRGELHYRRVNLSDLAQQVVSDLQQRQPERPVDVSIAEDCIVHGDSRLLQLVLENLLDNAWKFTSQASNAQVEFGCATLPSEEQVYYVQDNGVGFSMSYSSKLFRPFQRLHTEQEFPGTGIGLATVQRIIHRHGGRIWAEAAVGRGATFFFTIPDGSSS